MPAVAITGWTGLWDDLPAAHLTSVVFDALCALGLLFAGRRLAGWRLGVALAFAWAAYPFTAFALESNSNDMIVTAFAIWGFVWATSPVARGALLSLVRLDEVRAARARPALAALPARSATRARPSGTYGEDPGPLAAHPGAASACAGALWLGPKRGTPLALGGLRARHAARGAPAPAPEARTRSARFWDATFGYQLNRARRPSRSGTGAIYPGLPDLRWLQAVLKVALALGAVACLWVPRRLDAVRLAALSGALVIGFQLCLSYWFYTYIPWFFPFAMIALCAPSRVR